MSRCRSSISSALVQPLNAHVHVGIPKPDLVKADQLTFVAGKLEVVQCNDAE